MLRSWWRRARPGRPCALVAPQLAPWPGAARAPGTARHAHSGLKLRLYPCPRGLPCRPERLPAPPDASLPFAHSPSVATLGRRASGGAARPPAGRRRQRQGGAPTGREAPSTTGRRVHRQGGAVNDRVARPPAGRRRQRQGAAASPPVRPRSRGALRPRSCGAFRPHVAHSAPTWRTKSTRDSDARHVTPGAPRDAHVDAADPDPGPPQPAAPHGRRAPAQRPTVGAPQLSARCGPPGRRGWCRRRASACCRSTRRVRCAPPHRSAGTPGRTAR